LRRLRDDLKVKEQYIESMEDECRVAGRRVSDLENDLKTVKKECVDALSAKESALATQYKQFEGKNQALLKDLQELNSQLECLRQDQAEEVKVLRAQH
jgi:DNA repair exonuclease SbcCD ATPase subunit